MKTKLLLFFSFTLLSVFGYGQLSLSFTTTNVTCFGLCNGTSTVSSTGAVGPVSYAWSNGSIGPVVSNLCAGFYTCTATDGSGSSTANIFISSPSALIVVANNPYICQGQTINICASGAGGTFPYTYTYSPAFTNCALVTPSVTTTYSVVVNDANGCIATRSASITIFNNPVLTTNYLSFPSCGQSNGALTFSTAAAGCSYNTQSASQTYTTQALLNIPAGAYTVTATDTVYGCIVTQTLFFSDSCDLVWPGDANDDLTANNLDILSIGIGAGVTGTSRIHSSLNWVGQPSQNWPQSLVSGANYKHIDADGNGSISLSDTLAVIQNFNLTRPASRFAATNTVSGLPDLYLQPANDTIMAGASSKMSIMLGDATNTLHNVYGVAFTVHYNSSLITGSSFGINTAQSWMGIQNTNVISVGLKNTSAGTYETAIVRINQTTVSGNGKIGEIVFKSSANSPSSITPTTFTISNVKLIDYNENQIAVNPKPATIYIKSAATGLKEISDMTFNIYPNPTKDLLKIDASIFSAYTVKLLDLMGKEVDSKSFNGSSFDDDISNLPSGIYFVKVLNKGNTVKTQKLIIE